MDIRRRSILGQRKAASSGDDSDGSYTVVLNGQWRKSTGIGNPDSSLYDGVYESNSNYNVNSTAAIMYIDISGLSSFKLYIRSYAESNFDYVMVSQLDKTITGSSSYSDTALVKAHTRGNQQSGAAISSYTLVEFTGIDKGSHRITVVYRKDSSQHSGNDRGYVLIPKSQGSGGESGGGDVDIDTTYSIMYTSSSGKVVTPYDTTVFGANIISNTYVNGQGIITFDGLVTKIGSSAFQSCRSLTSITIPNSVTEIGYKAFYWCDYLTSITIPNRVTTIGEGAFFYCTSLTSITIPNSVIEIGNSAFYYCKLPTSVIIPDNVTSIGEEAFRDCESLKSVTIGNSVTSIGRGAFENCRSLTSVTIGNSVTSIGSTAFWECHSLTSVAIPDSVTSIGVQAFENCRSLTSVYCKPTTPPTGNSYMFNSNAAGRKIYVPTASVNAYKSAKYWSDYASYITGYNF